MLLAGPGSSFTQKELRMGGRASSKGETELQSLELPSWPLRQTESDSFSTSSARHDRPSALSRQKALTRQLLMALHHNQLSQAKAAVDAGADLNVTNSAGQTLLMALAARSPLSRKTLAWLKISGVNVNQQDKKGFTAMMHAIQQNNAVATKTLAQDNDVDINTLYETPESALENRLPHLKELHKTVNNTPHAIRDAKEVKIYGSNYIIQEAANVLDNLQQLSPHLRRNAVKLAAQEGNGDLFKVLLPRADLFKTRPVNADDPFDSDRTTVLSHAVLGQNSDIVDTILAQAHRKLNWKTRFDYLNHANAYSKTALHETETLTHFYDRPAFYPSGFEDYFPGDSKSDPFNNMLNIQYRLREEGAGRASNPLIRCLGF